ncbi:MAG: hypothetical protein AUI14_17655 [Actinobacteria bacterium 13_2_20CM_2_71_6]|nr:MAG: hypothetical protein AUI14_17655 [Actinobacteria bacterium 13_2_20CM_2_71_6]
MNADIERLLAGSPPPIAELGRQVCDRILALYPDAVVTVDNENVGFGSTKGYKGLVFVVSPHRAHVTLGIARGVGLPDPAGLMEGAGKVHRHVKIRSIEDLDRPELGALMAEALARAS